MPDQTKITQSLSPLYSYFRELKRSLIYGSWRRQHELTDGYSIILGTPMDMPFLLDLALDVLASTDISRCAEILVIPDGSTSDGGQRIKNVLSRRTDPRIRYVNLSLKWRLLIPHIHNHPAMMAIGAEESRCQFAFVHDLDAFLSSESTVERLFDECRQRKMAAMGVTERWDPGFRKMKMKIPGTWELFYDTTWLKSWPRQMIFGRLHDTPAGKVEFDSMLYPQYLDYHTGRIGVSQNAHDIVHFNGTVRTFRVYQESPSAVCDQLFRLLLLTLLETVSATPMESSTLPSVSELARGLTDPDAPILYNSDKNRAGYGEFRTMVGQMVATPAFRNGRGERIIELIAPFDKHFEYDSSISYAPAVSFGELRHSGLTG